MENAAKRLALQKAASMLVAARRDQLQSHPSPDDLAAYHAQALTPRRSDQIQDHLAFCRDCSRIVMQLAPEIGAARQYSPISDRRLLAAWERFVQQLASESPAAPLPAASALPKKARSTLAALAALLIAAAGMAFFSIWMMRSLPHPEANLPFLFLSSEKDSTRSEAREIARLPYQETGNLILVLQVSALDPFLRYGLTIEAENSLDALWRSNDLRKSVRGEFSVRLPRNYLPPGRYRLRLFGLSGDQETHLATFRLQIDPPLGR